jgi:hypothetical protein
VSGFLEHKYEAGLLSESVEYILFLHRVRYMPPKDGDLRTF